MYINLGRWSPMLWTRVLRIQIFQLQIPRSERYRAKRKKVNVK